MNNFLEKIIIIIKKKIKHDNVIIDYNNNVLQPYIIVNYRYINDFCKIIYKNKLLYFDFLSCISGIDYGIQKSKLGVVYHLISMPYNYRLALKLIISRNFKIKIPSVSDIWKTAEWHEREIFDLFGIKFIGNKDMRRILLPDDWVGNPLLKDYKMPYSYNGIIL